MKKEFYENWPTQQGAATTTSASQHHHLPTGPAVSQNFRSNIRKGRLQLVLKTLRQFLSLPPFRNGNELAHERIVGDDISFRLIPLNEYPKA